VTKIGDMLARHPAIIVPAEDLPSLFISPDLLSNPSLAPHLSIATPDDRATFCFTKGYGKLVDRAAGSLYSPTSTALQRNGWTVEERATVGVRMFHPNELLRLFGFPDGFSFPPTLSLRQRFNCIGNSVNVEVVRRVMHHLFHPSSAAASTTGGKGEDSTEREQENKL